MAILRPFLASDVVAVKVHTDREIGQDYFSIEELKDMQARSVKGELNASFLLQNESGDVCGLRLSFPPGQWHKGKGQQLSPESWGVPIESVGYFQSLFIAKTWQGQGWGKKLSNQSIEVLKKLGAQAVVCHSWRESPDGSSQAYLAAMGFKTVASYKEYWKQVDYQCNRCGKPCLCTADEMILKWDEGKP